MIRNLSTAGLAIIAASRFFWMEHSLAVFHFQFVNSCAQTRFPVAVIPGVSLMCANRTKLGSGSQGGRHVPLCFCNNLGCRLELALISSHNPPLPFRATWMRSPDLRVVPSARRGHGCVTSEQRDPVPAVK